MSSNILHGFFLGEGGVLCSVLRPSRDLLRTSNCIFNHFFSIFALNLPYDVLRGGGGGGILSYCRNLTPFIRTPKVYLWTSCEYDQLMAYLGPAYLWPDKTSLTTFGLVGPMEIDSKWAWNQPEPEFLRLILAPVVSICGAQNRQGCIVGVANNPLGPKKYFIRVLKKLLLSRAGTPLQGSARNLTNMTNFS